MSHPLASNADDHADGRADGRAENRADGRTDDRAENRADDRAEDRALVLALPSAVTSRFAVLVLTTLAGSYHLSLLLHGSLLRAAGAASEHVRQDSCLREVRAGAATMDPFLLTDRYRSCVLGVTTRETLTTLAMAAVPFLVALLLYLLHPRWRERGRRPRPLEQLDHDAGAPLAALVAERGRGVRVFVDENDLGTGASIYGFPGRYRLLVGLELVVTAATRPDRARAVLGHEFAHLDNRDVGLTYLAMALWWAFVGTMVVPVLVVTALPDPRSLLIVLLQVAALVAVQWLARRAVLRSREHYADVRSAGTAEDTESAVAVLRTLRTKSPWLSNHPLQRERVKVVRAPRLLLRPVLGELFAAGLLVGIAFSPLLQAVNQLGSQVTPEARSNALGLVFGVVLGAMVAAVICRAVAGGAARAPWRAAGCVTGGMLAGQVLTVAAPGAFPWTVLLPEPWLALSLALILLVTMRVHIGWVTACAAAARPASPRRRALVTMALSALVVGPWLGHWFMSLHVIGLSELSWTYTTFVFWSGMSSAPMLLAVVLAGAYLFWAEPRHVPAGAFPAPWLVTVLACAAFLVGGLWLHPVLAGARETSLAHETLSGYVLLGTAVSFLVLAASVIGAVTGGRGRTARAVAHAVVASLVACVPMVLIILLHSSVATCGWSAHLGCAVQEGSFPVAFRSYVVTLLGPALLLTMPAAVAGSGARRLVSGRRTVTVGSGPRSRTVVGLGAVGALVVTLAVIWNWSPRLTDGDWRIRPPSDPSLLTPVATGSIEPVAACREIGRAYLTPAVTLAVDMTAPPNLHMRLLRTAAAADDPVLYAMARAGVGSFDRVSGRGVVEAGRQIQHYCVLRLLEEEAAGG